MLRKIFRQFLSKKKKQILFVPFFNVSVNDKVIFKLVNKHKMVNIQVASVKQVSKEYLIHFGVTLVLGLIVDVSK